MVGPTPLYSQRFFSQGNITQPTGWQNTSSGPWIISTVTLFCGAATPGNVFIVDENSVAVLFRFFAGIIADSQAGYQNWTRLHLVQDPGAIWEIQSPDVGVDCSVHGYAFRN